MRKNKTKIEFINSSKIFINESNLSFLENLKRFNRLKHS